MNSELDICALAFLIRYGGRVEGYRASASEAKNLLIYLTRNSWAVTADNKMNLSLLSIDESR